MINAIKYTVKIFDWMDIPIVDPGTDRYHNPRKLTSTAACIIYKATQDGNTVIIKKFRDDNYFRIYDHAVRETTLLRNISHPNIVKLQEIWPEPSYPSLILEFSGKSLWVYAQPLSKKNRAEQFDDIFGQILSAMHYLHANGIIHRDIKATNVLIQNGVVKLCDFGLARRITGDELGTMAFTINYRPPEILAGNCNYKTSADMWAMGCMMYDFIIHAILFGKGTDDETDDIILEAVLKEVPTTVEELERLNIEQDIPIGDKWCKVDRLNGYLSTSKIDMIKALLSIHPNNRLSAKECRQILNQTPPFRALVTQQPFLMRKKIRSDLNVRYIMVSHILTIGDQFPISPFAISTAVDIYDRFLIINQKKEIDQTKLILYYIAAVILSSCIHDSHKLHPADFESVYKDTDIANAMKTLFHDINYSIDSMSIWQIVNEQVKLGILENSEEKMALYWEKVKEMYLDYQTMVDLTMLQLTQKISRFNTE
jgi:serine/threonine protein kinase